MKKGFIPLILLVGLGAIIIAGATLAYLKISENRPKLDYGVPTQLPTSKISTPSASTKIAVPKTTPSPTPTDDPNNFGKPVNNYTKPFNANDFGINSPLFSGKQVSYLTYRFHQKEITEKQIIISDTPSPYEIAEVWEFTKPSSLDISNPDYAIFSGFENYAGFPTFLKDIQAGWKEFYTNKNSIKFGYSYYGVPNYPMIVQLDSFQNASISGSPIFIRLNVNASKVTASLDDPAILDAKEKLKQSADTISLVK